MWKEAAGAELTYFHCSGKGLASLSSLCCSTSLNLGPWISWPWLWTSSIAINNFHLEYYNYLIPALDRDFQHLWASILIQRLSSRGCACILRADSMLVSDRGYQPLELHQCSMHVTYRNKGICNFFSAQRLGSSWCNTNLESHRFDVKDVASATH
jgi:hypothetical protein